MIWIWKKKLVIRKNIEKFLKNLFNEQEKINEKKKLNEITISFDPHKLHSHPLSYEFNKFF